MNPLSLLSTIDCRWLLEEGYYNAVVATLQDKSLVDYFLRVEQTRQPQSRTLVSARMASLDDEDRRYAVKNGIAIIPVDGPLTKRSSWMSYYYGGTSTTDALLALQQATSDPDVYGILLLIDSPGGQVAGTFDFADEIARVVAAGKTVFAYVSDLCASAAYAVGSQASKMYGNRTALVGSIGTYMVLRDYSKMYEEAGIKTEVVRAGKHKGAGTSGTALTKEHLAEFQRNVDSLNAQFLQSVQAGRSLSDEAIADIADGRVWVGQEAVDLGLLDGVATLDATLDLLQSACRSRPRMAW